MAEPAREPPSQEIIAELAREPLSYENEPHQIRAVCHMCRTRERGEA